jgi:lambda family phage portal protein
MNYNCRVGRQIPKNIILNTSDRERMYAAAKTSRLTGDWIPANQDINSLVRSSSPILRARIRQLTRDFPYFERACNILVDYTVGSGINFQSRVINPNWKPGGKEKKFDRKICQQIEDAVSFAMDEIDASGKQHFNDLARLLARQEVESGESLFVKTTIRDPKRYIPYAIQVFEADWLSSTPGSVAAGNEFDQGIEFDPKTGRAVAYHLATPSGYSLYNFRAATSIQRINAEDVNHHFDLKRPGQLRGVSPFVTAVLIAHDLQDYLDATIDTAKLAAKYLAMVETSDVTGFQQSRAVNGSGADQGKKIEELENAIIEYLRPGEKITFAKNEPTGATFDPFTRFVLRMLSIATGTPYSLISGDHASYNYTSLRGERQDMLKMFEPRQSRHIRYITAPIVNDIIYWAVLSGKLNLPGYFQNPHLYHRGVYIPPGNEPIDPLRESKANRDDIAAGLRSPQEIVARRGRDLEEVLDEMAEAREMAEERGLHGLFSDYTDTALATAPSALGAAETVTGKKSSKVVAIRRAIEDAFEDAALLAEEI